MNSTTQSVNHSFIHNSSSTFYYMDSFVSSLLDLMPRAFGLCFFTFTILFSLFSLSIFLLTFKQGCNCDICRSYVTRSWSKDFNNLSDWYAHLLRNSPTGTIHLHVLRNTITANPENVEHIVKTNFDNYPKGKQFSTILGDLLGRGIFNVDGDSWKFQRKLASAELGSVSIRLYAFDLVKSEINSRLIPLLSSFSSQNRVLDLQDVFQRFSFDNISKFSFGLDLGCLNLSLPISDFAVAFDGASQLSAQRALASSPMIWKIKRLFNFGSERKLKQYITMINEFADEMITQRRTTGFVDKKDLLSRFMGSVDDNSYLRDIVISFILAGRDTVASGLTILVMLISQHPQVAAAILKESDRAMGTSGYLMASFEQIREMHYLTAVVYEGLRLYPPVQFDSKFSIEDDVLPDGTFVKGGIRVTYHPYAMGRMEKIWGADCLEFKPERWLSKGVFVPENLFKYPVFQAGPRVCLGKELALVEMKSVVLALVRAFDFQVVDSGKPLQFVAGLTASLRGGLPVVVRKRERTV